MPHSLATIALRVVPSEGPPLRQRVARQKGATVELIVSPGADHGFKGTNLQPSVAEINQRTVTFSLQPLAPSPK